ncbi:NADPH-dependent FMN/FAD containing oxidoreductase [Tricladium varicosporioides]|nr:NADPH-dependent FMN/FAD containing oxidoreductase [Hymenoscyphus varicosporioides]
MAEAVPGQRDDRSALVLYGSETGNSQDVAEELGRMVERLHFVTRVSEMDLVEINLLLKYPVVIFAISTTGQGEFPKNARKFWKSLLRKRLPPGCLRHVRFTTLGLGDTSYPKYNWAARKLHKRLEQLGAQEIYPRGEADEQHEEGIDGTFLSWSADLRTHLLKQHPLPEGLAPIPSDVLLPPKYFLSIAKGEVNTSNSLEEKISAEERELSDQRKVTPTQDKEEVVTSSSTQLLSTNGRTPISLIHGDPKMLPMEFEAETCQQLKESSSLEPESVDLIVPDDEGFPAPHSFEVQLISNRRVTPADHWQDVRLLTFIMSKQHGYEPGDSMTIYPKNFPEDVQALIDLMDWNRIADKRVEFQATEPNFFASERLTAKVTGLYPTARCTLRSLLMHNLDITAIPKRHFFEIIAHYTDDPMHKERLQEFSNPIYTDEFYDYTSRPRRSILEVLQDFPTVKIPWRFATTIFPLMRGRQYSVASGGILKQHHNSALIKVELLVALVKYRTVLKKIRQGLCSRYLATLQKGSILSVTMNTSSFNNIVSKNPQYPILLIGPGTGIAPLRSLLWERASIRPNNSKEDKSSVGPALLIYGGRNKHADFFFEEEWRCRDLGVEVFTAFSRDQKEKIYVQDVIRAQSKKIFDFLLHQGFIFVCGSSGNMPKAVREAIVDVIFEHTPTKTRAEAVAAVEEIERKGHYVQETW